MICNRMKIEAIVHLSTPSRWERDPRPCDYKLDFSSIFGEGTWLRSHRNHRESASYIEWYIEIRGQSEGTGGEVPQGTPIYLRQATV